MELVIHVDGGARGNPGPAGAGVVIRDRGGRLIFEAGYYLGRQTNNVAEYNALIRALERAGRCNARALAVYCDSELLVRQLTGEYQVKSPRLVGLFQRAQLLLLKVARWSVHHIPREANARADELANLAMDHQRDIIVFDADGGGQAIGPPESTTPEPPPPVEPASTQPDSEPTAPGTLPATPVVTKRAVHVVVSQSPDSSRCPAQGLGEAAFVVGATLPAGLCLHAAHAILPTLLAMLNTEPREFASVPTLTVRCSFPGCGAVFQLSPVRSPNGARRDKHR